MLFKDHYQNAPQKIQEVVDSFETAETLARIAADHSVDDNKGIGNRDLGRLTGRVLVGMIHPKDFVPSLAEKLDIKKDRAQEIAREVNQKIFSQVKNLLIEIHGLKNPSKNSQTLTSEQAPLTVPQKEKKIPPVPQAPAKQSSPKPTNPFEEKLRQTFAIPSSETRNKEEGPIAESSGVTKPASAKSLPADKQDSDEVKPVVAESFGGARPSSVENSGEVKKKEEIKNNPYLETID